MKTYKTIFTFEVFEKINDGEQVYVLDRQNKSVALLNDMDAQSAVKIVNEKSKEGRYEFWYEKESEVTEE